MYPLIGADYTHLGGLGDENDDLDQVGGDDLLETGGVLGWKSSPENGLGSILNQYLGTDQESSSDQASQ